MNRWYKDPKGWKQSLSPGESILVQLDGVRLDDGENKTSYSNGDVFLTTHRLIWSNSKISPDLILPLSLVVFAEEEQTSGFMKSEKCTLHLSMAPPNPPG